jgi:virginiamycin B lyase
MFELSRSLLIAAILTATWTAVPLPASAGRFSGRVVDSLGAPVEGVLISFSSGETSSRYTKTVYSAADGRFETGALLANGPFQVRARRIGWKEIDRKDVIEGSDVGLVLERETDPAVVAGQLPANRWYGLALDRIDDETQREQFVRQCTYCHQQGSWATRVQRTDVEWQKVLSLMARMGGGISAELRAELPALLNAAYDPKTAVPQLTARMNEPGFSPPPAEAVTRASVEEWVLGSAASMQHDLAVHPNGRVYSVDMTQDKLYELDPSVPGGARRSWLIPHGDLALGGVFGGLNSPTTPSSNAYVGPHSLQMASDGSIWITLALGNQLARFDLASETWSVYPLEEGFYPHTLRIDARGRVWYTIAASNHVGVYDPESDVHRWIRVPAPSLGQAIASRLVGPMLWLAKRIDISGAAAAGEGAANSPVPYGIDVSPNGDIWFSQLNSHKIGRIDPDSFEVEMVDTPFTAPRRLRFDSKGHLWIPGFSSGLVSRFDPDTRAFQSWTIPIEPIGTETPYALNVDSSDTVWICGTNSDSLIRFDPSTEVFTVYPLPTRVTYTREVDFDAAGRVWTSNSNAPTWQIEGGVPRVLRLDPSAFDKAAARNHGETSRDSAEDVALSGSATVRD